MPALVTFLCFVLLIRQVTKDKLARVDHLIRLIPSTVTCLASSLL